MSSQKELEAVISCLLRHVAGCKLNRTQLVKLVFLVDYESYIMSNETITGVTYRYDKQGPFSWDIPNTAESMTSVEYRRVPNFFVGAPENIYTLGRAETDSGLTEEREAVCRRVARAFGDMSAKALVEYTHADPFVDRFRGGKTIEFSELSDDEDIAVISKVYDSPEFCKEIKAAEHQLRNIHQV